TVGTADREKWGHSGFSPSLPKPIYCFFCEKPECPHFCAISHGRGDGAAPTEDRLRSINQG
ncbi:MAG: hypothetical protein KJO31_05060, partial [Gammaproteobacteria bacterium]|nr:hypothetical protein [Gammaproteobacteria bacterium]